MRISDTACCCPECYVQSVQQPNAMKLAQCSWAPPSLSIPVCLQESLYVCAGHIGHFSNLQQPKSLQQPFFQRVSPSTAVETQSHIEPQGAHYGDRPAEICTLSSGDRVTEGGTQAFGL